jgi:hypothetical protein
MFVLLLVFCRTVLDPGLSPQIFINCCRLTLFAHFCFVCHILTYRLSFSIHFLFHLSCLQARLCSKVATIFCSSWDECTANLWTLPTFSEPSNMTRDDLATPVAAAATAQVKLCPYDEEEPRPTGLHTALTSFMRIFQTYLFAGRFRIHRNSM